MYVLILSLNFTHKNYTLLLRYEYIYSDKTEVVVS
jgi:hypothetical protein